MTDNLHDEFQPNTFNVYLGQQHIIPSFKGYVLKKMLPKGAILYGDYGVGKSALINVFANEFYGDLSDSDRVRMCKIVDASSDGRGVSLITDDFTNFAKSPTVCSRDGRLKLFVIEEADNLTKAAQSFLKSAMDLQKNRVRVFFLTNHIEKINEGIKERCVGAIFKFKPVPAVEIRDRLVYIIKDNVIGSTNNGTGT